MYRYDQYDHALLRQRVAQFRDQTRRWQAGELSDDEFRPLRLQNGLYVQRHAPMFRIAVPYGLLAARQLRVLAQVSRDYDRGYGHFTTRHNLQLNWVRIEDVPDILEKLAAVELHAIQTSGNCIRNVTTDHFAGVAPDELLDPRPIAEILRQWSTFHPECAFLPRKFKIAINAATEDRAVILAHDIGLSLYKDANGEIRARVAVGGGLGRTPIIGQIIHEDLPWQHLLTYLEAILRVYNQDGRRDNPYKARIKILVQSLGAEEFRRQVDAEWAHLKNGPATLTEAEYQRIAAHFDQPAYATFAGDDAGFQQRLSDDPAFARWVSRNVHGHRVPGYRAVTLSLKAVGQAPGDITADQLDAAADLADRFSFGEIRVSHEQNLILADVPTRDLHDLWQGARAAGLATPTIGLLTDVICCPGGDFCSLANAKSIPVARAIQERFDDLDYLHDIGDIELNISGCMNACGHHHVGHIGVLGVDKNGEEWYQVTLGGSQGHDTRIGKVIGPSFTAEEMPDVVSEIIATYLAHRTEEERFLDTYRRIGATPFKERVYARHSHQTGRKPSDRRNAQSAQENPHG